MNKLHNKDFSIAFKRGTDTNRAKFKKEAVQGEVYFATDTGGFYIAESSAGASEATLSEFSQIVTYNATENLQSGDFGGSSTATSIDISNAGSVLQGSAWSVGGWVKSTDSSGTNQAIISSGTGTSNEMILSYDGSTGQFRGTSRATSSSNQVTSSTGNSVDQWHHVALTFDGTSSVKMYVDGVADGTGTGEVLTNTGVSNLKIGDNAHGTGFLTGNLDQLFLYDKELTATEVANIVSSKTIPGPSALYRLNGNANDETGNFNGTATNLSFSTSEIPYTSVSSNGTYILPTGRTYTGDRQVFTIPSYSIGSTFSFTTWIQFAALSGKFEYLFTSGGSNCNLEIYVPSSSGPAATDVEIFAQANGNGNKWNYGAKTNFSTSSWYHLAFVYNGSNTTFYLDASQLGTDSGFNGDGLGVIPGTSGLHNGTEETDPRVGYPVISQSGPTQMYSKLADVALFDYALTAQQVSDIYNDRKYVNPLALYRLNNNLDDETGQRNGSAVLGSYQSSTNPY